MIVDVWYALTEDPIDAPAILALLDPDERARHDAFRFERNRREYLATRGLERAVLARLSGRAPASLRLRRTDLGRPVLDDGGELRYSLTNTLRLVACVAAEGREVGLDAEPLERAPEVVSVADRVFTVAERATLATLVEKERRALELWTAKEAYLKARGLGFALPPEQLELDVRGQPRDIRVSPDHDARPTRWQLASFELAGHVVTVCIETAEITDIAVHRVDLNVPCREGESR